jgi:hypothetical protein
VTEPQDATTGTATFTACLIGHGRQPWSEIRPLLEGCTCAWADLDGFHAEPPPADPPLATHLWAWNDGKPPPGPPAKGAYPSGKHGETVPCTSTRSLT